MQGRAAGLNAQGTATESNQTPQTARSMRAAWRRSSEDSFKKVHFFVQANVKHSFSGRLQVSS